jgi:hypothetical protein
MADYLYDGDDGDAIDCDDAAAALDAFLELTPDEQEKRIDEATKEQELERDTERQDEQAQPEAEEQSPNERSALLHKHQDLAILASAAVVDAVAPPVPEVLNRDSRSVLRRIFGEHEQNGVVNQQQMR